MNYSVMRQTIDPIRTHTQDAGIDVYVPDFIPELIQYMKEINTEHSYNIKDGVLTIYPHQRIKLPTGIYFDLPKNNMLLVLQKTSVPNKTGIISGARVIDPGYRGEFIASLINTSDKDAILLAGQRFIQVVLVPINPDRTVIKKDITELFSAKEQSSRGTGSYGSTGMF